MVLLLLLHHRFLSLQQSMHRGACQRIAELRIQLANQQAEEEAVEAARLKQEIAAVAAARRQQQQQS